MTHSSRVTQLRLTLVVVLAGLIMTAMGGWIALSADRQAVRRELRGNAKLHAKIIEARFSELEHPVLTAADFLAADLDHNPMEFLRFANFAAPHAPIVQWLGWAPLVPAGDRGTFETTARKRNPNFQIADRSGDALVRAPARPAYFPLYAIRNFRGRSVPLGLDLAGDRVLRRTAERARDEGRAVATGPLPSLDEGKSGEITILIAPVYRDGITALRGIAARRNNLTGYIVGGYGMDAVLGFVTAGVMPKDETISFARPPPAIGFGQAMAATPAEMTRAAAGPSLAPPARNEYRFVQPLTFSGQVWTATFAFSPEAVARHRSYAPFGWLGAGLLLTTALGTITARGESRRLAIEQLVATRTQELSGANERLRQSAETLEATLAATPLGMIALDADANITQWNRGAERIFGYTAPEVLGKPYFPLMVPNGHRTEADALFQRACNGERLRDVAVQRQRRDGAMLDIRIAGDPLRDAEGRLRGVVFATQDVTESLRLEEQLQQAQKMEAIGQLTGGVAHDFNNLLGTAITSIDLLRDRIKDDAEGTELAADALDALLHGADLVRRLLAFARRQPLQPEHVRLNVLVLEAVRLLRPLLGDAIEISLELGKDLWPVLVDRAQFETTLINLATNGRDAMPHGGQLHIVTCNLRVTAQAPARNPEVVPGDYVVVEVSDTGTGMPPALLRRIFEPFFTTKGKSVGTGLGLSTVLGFIKQSGGHIDVESEPGRGSCFRLYLSRHAGDAPTAATPFIAEDAGQSPEHQGEVVLVVEDNAGLRHSVLHQMTKFGYHVMEAEDAAGALARLESGETIDLLFTDVMLPGGMTGIELAAVARSRWPSLKILLTSGFPEALLDEPSSLADLRLIGKPYREEELARTLREVLTG